jgi:hypothetical protein
MNIELKASDPLARRAFRGMNSTIKGASKKFGSLIARGSKKQFGNQGKPKKWSQGFLTDNVMTRGPGQSFGYENALMGGGLAGMRPKPKAQAGRGGGLRTRGGTNSRVARNWGFSETEFKDIIEFAMNPGIDPNLIEGLIQDASRIQQEGQTKIVISQQLFQQIQAALQNYQIQKQQVDGMTAERIQSQGFEAGYDSILEFAKRKEKGSMVMPVVGGALAGATLGDSLTSKGNKKLINEHLAAERAAERSRKEVRDIDRNNPGYESGQAWKMADEAQGKPFKKGYFGEGERGARIKHEKQQRVKRAYGQRKRRGRIGAAMGALAGVGYIANRDRKKN